MLELFGQRERHGVDALKEGRPLDPADPMFGADAAVHAIDDGEDNAFGALEQGGHLLGRLAGRGNDVEMDVAVPDMAVGDRLGLRHGACQGVQRGVEEVGHARDRHGHVGAVVAAALALVLHHHLAIEPQLLGLRLAGGDRAVDHEVVGAREAVFEDRSQVDGAAGGKLHDDIGGIGGSERFGQRGGRAQRHFEARPEDQLEGGKQIATRAPRQGEERHRILGGAQADQRHLDLRRPGEQLERRGGDQAERPFAADEHLLEVVAAIVLAQGAQPVPHAAVRQHDLQPEHEVARHAVAQHVEAAGVGGDIAADAAGPLRAEGDGQQAVGLLGRLLGNLQHAASLHHHGKVERVDRAHGSHPLEAHHQLPSAGIGDGGADQPGQPALGHDGHARRRAMAHQ